MMWKDERLKNGQIIVYLQYWFPWLLIFVYSPNFYPKRDRIFVILYTLFLYSFIDYEMLNLSLSFLTLYDSSVTHDCIHSI